MNGWDLIRFAIRSLASNLSRSVLTVLGFAVGAGAILTVLTLGEAGEARVEEEISKLGVNKVWIRANDEHASFQTDDAALLTEMAGAPACASAYTFAPIMVGEKVLTGQIIGLDERMQAVHGYKLVAGRILNQRDDRQGSLCCLIDETLAEAGELDIGSALYAGNRRFIVVGIMEVMAGQNAAGSNGMMIIPLSTYFETFGGDISEIVLHVPQGKNAEAIAETALSLMTQFGDFRTETLEAEIDAAREVIRIFVAVLMAVALVCMLSGGIGVMNVLVLTVHERRQEIGMIKAVGGTSVQICLLFLAEASMYAILGSGAGIFMGGMMICCCGALIGIAGRIKVMQAVVMLLAALGIGIVFGVMPAASAARLAPVAALRND